MARKTSKPAAPAKIAAVATKTVVKAAPADPVQDPIANLQDTIKTTVVEAEALQERLHRVAEEGTEQTKRLYETVKAATDEATDTLEDSLQAVTRGVHEINLKALDALKANADAQFDFVKSLLATRSLSDLLALQGEHARVQFETMSEQAKEISSLIQKVSTESVAPLKASFTRSLQSAT